MKYLPHPHGMIPVLLKILRQKWDRFFQGRSEMVIIYLSVNTGRGRPQSCQYRRPGWSAQRGLAVRIGKQYAARSQPVDIRCQGSVIIQTSQEGVQVIDTDHQYVGRIILGRASTRHAPPLDQYE